MQETQETQIWSLRQEGLLEKGMVTYSSILAWRITWTKELGGLESMGCKESDNYYLATKQQQQKAY